MSTLQDQLNELFSEIVSEEMPQERFIFEMLGEDWTTDLLQGKEINVALERIEEETDFAEQVFMASEMLSALMIGTIAFFKIVWRKVKFARDLGMPLPMTAELSDQYRQKLINAGVEADTATRIAENYVTKAVGLVIKENEVPEIFHIRPIVFVSFCQEDQHYMAKFARFFVFVEDKIEFWHEGKIKPGEDWHEKTQNILRESKVAVVLLSANYFNVEGILKWQLPDLVKTANARELTIIPVLLSPCPYHRILNLDQFKLANPRDVSIMEMTEADQERLWGNIATSIEHLIE